MNSKLEEQQIEPIASTRYKTTDGKLHESFDDALNHQAYLNIPKLYVVTKDLWVPRVFDSIEKAQKFIYRNTPMTGFKIYACICNSHTDTFQVNK